jgi:hypothetical protein
VDREEMIRILEEIIRDPDTNATTRCHGDPHPARDSGAAGGRSVPVRRRGGVADDGTRAPRQQTDDSSVIDFRE